MKAEEMFGLAGYNCYILSRQEESRKDVIERKTY